MKILIRSNITAHVEAMIKLLKDNDYHTLTADSSRLCISLLENDNEIEMIILDKDLPHGDSFKFIKLVKSNPRFCWMPFLIIGDSFDENTVQKLLESGITEIMVLPTRLEAIKAKIEVCKTNGRRNILIIDDDKDILSILKTTLEIERFNVTTATSAEEGLERLESEKIHLVVSDILLGEMTGLEFLVKAKTLYGHLPIILITGFSGNFGPEEALASGADGYFAKPFRNTELMYTLRRLLQCDGNRVLRTLGNNIDKISKSVPETTKS